MKISFNEKKGVIVNPYIGFTSFQHFRGEKLYSDCITGRQGVAGCETENYECYPIPSGVEENGREQGYYPDTTVAYVRILWKEFEPECGVYNYQIIQDVLDKAKSKGQTVMFRLMPHSTCERDDVPDWLKKLIPCPVRPEGMRVKDSPTDPLYLKLFGKAIQKIGEKFDTDPTLDCMDISLGGSWGEGSQAFGEEQEKTLMDIYVKYFPNTKLIGQCGNPEMLNYIATFRAVGWRSDGTGNPKHTHIWFPDYFPKVKNEHWKTAPVSFESYWWISEWLRQGWDIDEVIEFTLSHHISTFNNKSFPIQYELKDKIERWLEKMGYRFFIKELQTDGKVKAGEKITLKLNIKNTGVAPIYNNLPVKIRLKGKGGTFTFDLPVDIRKWMPGENFESLTLDLSDMTVGGEYVLSVSIGGGKYPVVIPANEVTTDGEYFDLAKINIQ